MEVSVCGLLFLLSPVLCLVRLFFVLKIFVLFLTDVFPGFFTFISDTEEQDIEFLSSDPEYFETVHYTDQPGTVDGVVDPDAALTVVIEGADFTCVSKIKEFHNLLRTSFPNFSAFGEHRIDWLTTSTNYYYNSALKGVWLLALVFTQSYTDFQQKTIMKNVPTVGSEVVVNVWSNGDPEFSQGPPTADAIATLQYLELYFNSTSLTEAEFNSACSAAGNVAPCSV